MRLLVDTGRDMTTILGYFWRLCLLRASPAHVPGSRAVLSLLIGLYAFAAILALSLTRPLQTWPDIVGITFTSLLIQGAMTFALLAFKNAGNRFPSTWGALLGTNAIILLIGLPVELATVNTDNETIQRVSESVSWVCFGWWLAIAGNILHKSGNISILQGSVIAFVMEMASAFATVRFFPAG